MKMLALLKSGKRVINVDESSLPHSDFRRKKWRIKGDNNSYSAKALGYKLNLITAIDTTGQVYLSITQFNTTSNVMMMFLSRLAAILT